MWIVCVLLAGVVALTRAQEADRRRFELTPAGNEARYRVREQLMSINLPSDAVGATSAVTGGVVLDARGKVIPAESKLKVDITGLTSNSSMRDRIIQSRTLNTDRFPTVEVTINDLPGLNYPWNPIGGLRFELTGDLTVHGVTKPSTWQVIAKGRDGGLAGTATTSFTFDDFGMTRPTGASVFGRKSRQARIRFSLRPQEVTKENRS